MKKVRLKQWQKNEQRSQDGLALLKEGLSPAAVAERLGVCRATVYNWLARADSPQGAIAKPGAKPALSPAQERALLEMLAQGAVNHGFPNEVWTAKRIAKLIRRHFAVQYHFKSIPALLARLGWSWQKPEKRAKGHNDEQIARWAAEDWPRIKKKGPAAGGHDHLRR